MDNVTAPQDPALVISELNAVEDIEGFINGANNEEFVESDERQRGTRMAGLLKRFRRNESAIEPSTDQSGPYPQIDRKEARSHWVDNSPESIERLRSYTQALFPNEEIQLLSTEGSGAMLFQDKNGRAYKVARDADHYTYDESEMRSLTLLHEAGFAPKPFMLVDAAVKYRRDPEGIEPEACFPEVPITRYEGNGPLPIIVMEKVDFSSIHDLSDEEFADNIESILEFAQAKELVFGDVQPVVDKKTGKVVIIDAGGLGQMKPRMREVRRIDGSLAYLQMEDATYEEYKQADITRWLLSTFDINTSLEEAAALVKDGSASLRRFIYDKRYRPTRQ